MSRTPKVFGIPMYHIRIVLEMNYKRFQIINSNDPVFYMFRTSRQHMQRVQASTMQVLPPQSSRCQGMQMVWMLEEGRSNRVLCISLCRYDVCS